ncbi:hypothetical protein SAMN06265367_1211, partial [Algoriphagus winogradskyi]
MKKGLRKNEALPFHLTDFIAGKLLLSRAYVLFKSVADYNEILYQSHQLFLTTLP